MYSLNLKLHSNTSLSVNKVLKGSFNRTITQNNLYICANDLITGKMYKANFNNILQ